VKVRLLGVHPQLPDLLAGVHKDLATSLGLDSTDDMDRVFGASVPEWPAFADSAAALAFLSSQYRLVILSNVDRVSFAGSNQRLKVMFDAVYTAEEIGSYKPAHGHWREFFARTGADPALHVHVAASLFHDVAPADELGIPVVWINRLGESPEPEPTRELPDLSRLADTLDELVPSA